MTERYQIRVFTAWNRWARSSSTSTVRSAIPSRGWSMSLRSDAVPAEDANGAGPQPPG